MSFPVSGYFPRRRGGGSRPHSGEASARSFARSAPSPGGDGGDLVPESLSPRVVPPPAPVIANDSTRFLRDKARGCRPSGLGCRRRARALWITRQRAAPRASRETAAMYPRSLLVSFADHAAALEVGEDSVAWFRGSRRSFECLRARRRSLAAAAWPARGPFRITPSTFASGSRSLEPHLRGPSPPRRLTPVAACFQKVARCRASVHLERVDKVRRSRSSPRCAPSSARSSWWIETRAYQHAAAEAKDHLITVTVISAAGVAGARSRWAPPAWAESPAAWWGWTSRRRAGGGHRRGRDRWRRRSRQRRFAILRARRLLVLFFGDWERRWFVGRDDGCLDLAITSLCSRLTFRHRHRRRPSPELTGSTARARRSPPCPSTPCGITSSRLFAAGVTFRVRVRVHLLRKTTQKRLDPHRVPAQRPSFRGDPPSSRSYAMCTPDAVVAKACGDPP